MATDTQFFCSHCWSDLDGADAERCPGCDADLTGCGRFDIVVGERPSEIFRALVADAQPAAASARPDSRLRPPLAA